MEIRREEDIKFNGNVFSTKCIKCGKEIELWFNGGELDERQCCGLMYSTEINKIDLVIEKEKQ